MEENQNQENPSAGWFVVHRSEPLLQEQQQKSSSLQAKDSWDYHCITASSHMWPVKLVL